MEEAGKFSLQMREVGRRWEENVEVTAEDARPPLGESVRRAGVVHGEWEVGREDARSHMVQSLRE